MGAVVLMVRVELTELFAAGVADEGFTEQVGARAGAGSTEQVSATALVKPSMEVRVTAEVALFPADSAFGAGDEAVNEKSGATKFAITV